MTLVYLIDMWIIKINYFDEKKWLVKRAIDNWGSVTGMVIELFDASTILVNTSSLKYIFKWSEWKVLLV